MYAMKGYLPSVTLVPPAIMGLTEAEEGCSSAAARGTASPLCTNTKKDTPIAATNAPTKVAHNGSLTIFSTAIALSLLSLLGGAQQERHETPLRYVSTSAMLDANTIKRR